MSRSRRSWSMSIVIGALGASGCWLVAGLEDRSPSADNADGEVRDGDRNDGGPKNDGPPADAGEAGTRCARTAAFTKSSRLDSISSPQTEYSATLSSDEREIFFASEADQADAGAVGARILRATRTDRAKDFETPTVVTSIHSTNAAEMDPCLSRDGKTLYFAVQGFAGTTTGYDVAAALRSDPEASFSNSYQVAAASTSANETTPAISRGDDELYWMADTKGVSKIYRARKASVEGGAPDFIDPAVVTDFGLAAASSLRAPVLSDDGLTIYFSAAVSDSRAERKIMQAIRSSPVGTFSAAAEVTSVNIASAQRPVWLSPDDCRLYVVQNRGPASGFDFYVFERSP